MRDSEKTLRLQSGELHPRGCKNSKHNCSTQTDICNCKSSIRQEKVCKDTCDSLENGGNNSTHSHHKSFSNCSQHSCSLSMSHSLSEPHPAFSYQRQELSPRSLTFTPLVSNCSPPQSPVDRGQSPPVKAGGGTWPKVIVGASLTECTQLSIFKKPKQRKSIFEVNAFRRPETASKLDYMSKHSPQSSASETSQTPPTPPTRSDSFRFKHRQQNSSASDSTITTGTPPASLALAASPQDEGFVGSQEYYTNIPAGKNKKNFKEEDESRRRTEVQEKRRYRPKSAPALRRNVTPLHIPVPMQVTDQSCNKWIDFHT